MQHWYTAQELAGLHGVPGTDRGLRKVAERESWESRRRAGTKAMEYAFTSLPDQTRAALIEAAMAQVPVAQTPEPVTAAVAKVDAPAAATVAELTDRQREVADARLAFVREIHRLVPVIGKEKAIAELVARAKAGTLPPHLQDLVRVANAKAGANRALSRRRLYDWCSQVDGTNERARLPVVLAPRTKVVTQALPAWAPYLLKLWSQPQKPALAQVVALLQSKLPAEVEPPTYNQAYRFLKRLSVVDREKGRLGTRAMKNLLPFRRRGFDQLLPADIYSADGHTFDAEVAHPMHGRPFRPEITTVIDVATRVVVGWSVDLAESGFAVLDAIRRSAIECSAPAIFYVDNGSGYDNALMKAEGTGLLSRLGTTVKHSLPYNAQAKGVIERVHQTLWVTGAKTLPTYMGKDMDAEAKQKVYKLTRRDIKDVGRSQLLLSWDDFIAWCAAQVATYNARPHSSLPKVRDTNDGRLRHMTPAEAWAQGERNGFTAERVSPEEADDLFRPQIERTVLRGEIKLFNNIYFDAALAHYHDEVVRVGYDILDAGQVWVRDQEGRLICKAKWNANRADYMPVSQIEQSREKRADERRRRLELRLAEVEQERRGGQVLEHQVPADDTLQQLLHELNHLPAAIEAEPVTRMRETAAVIPMPASDEDKFERWLRLKEVLENGGTLSEDDEYWVDSYGRSRKCAAMLELRGMGQLPLAR